MIATEHIFSNSNRIISDIINRLLNTSQTRTLYIYGDLSDHSLDGIYKNVKIFKIMELDDSMEGVFYFSCKSRKALCSILPWIRNNRCKSDIIIYLTEDFCQDDDVREELGFSCRLERFSSMSGRLFLIGKTFGCSKAEGEPPADFKVLAIIHTYNEADILERLLTFLLGQELDIYIVDNWSDDGTYEIARKVQAKYSGRIYVERFPEGGKTEYYEWYQQLKRTEEISKCMPYNWFIHYDADEMRVSPWSNKTLRQAIYYIDRLGYNLIENTVIDFKLTGVTSDDIFMGDTYFDFGHKNTHFLQTKTWKKSDEISIKESGGHVALIPDPKVFTLKILNRHYPFRSILQAEKKVFRDRKPRFVKERRERGWHGHYEMITDRGKLLENPSRLLEWGENTYEEYYIPLFLGCGIAKEKIIRSDTRIEVPHQLHNKNIVVYGAGKIGKAIYTQLVSVCNIVRWVDKRYRYIPDMFCETIASPESIIGVDFDYIVIAVADAGAKKEILVKLMEMSVDTRKIILEL